MQEGIRVTQICERFCRHRQRNVVLRSDSRWGQWVCLEPDRCKDCPDRPRASVNPPREDL